MPYCGDCGQLVPEGNAFCTNCGKPMKKDPGTSGPPQAPVYAPPPPQPAACAPPSRQKNKWIPTLLTFIFCGLGQVYNGEFKKGMAYCFGSFIVGVILMLLRVVMWPVFIIIAIAAYDAYISTEKMNNGQIPYREYTKPEIILYIIIWIIIMIINISVRGYMDQGYYYDVYDL